MPVPGPEKGAAPRTLRGIALEKGTNPQGFVATPAYDAQAGVPEGAEGGAAGQEYRDVAEAARPANTPPPAGANETPFKLGG